MDTLLSKAGGLWRVCLPLAIFLLALAGLFGIVLLALLIRWWFSRETEPRPDDLATDEPEVAVPTVDDLAADEPTVAAPMPDDFDADEPTVAAPGPDDLAADEPAVAAPGPDDLAADEPAVAAPGPDDLAAVEPTVAAPVAPVLREIPEPVVDDLTMVEGIGPKISSLCLDSGISTFAELAATEVDRLRQILADARLTHLADPTTWPEQASLAAAGQWDRLAALQDELKGGRRR
jgi:predicted flap endonuclease-1-like 5' DNA nuclease